MLVNTRVVRIEWGDCDPAGIIYYPRYFAIFDACTSALIERALGMTNSELMRHIILPQAIKRMVPPFVNQSIIQLKNTSLLYVVAVPDLMYTGSIVVSDTFRPLEVYTSVGVMYFAILYPLTLWASRMEARVDQ